jgi:hypothetical protein
MGPRRCELTVDVTTEVPAATLPAGGNKEWRLRADTLSMKKMSDEQLEGLRHRSRLHLNSKSASGVHRCDTPSSLLPPRSSHLPEPF